MKKYILKIATLLIIATIIFSNSMVLASNVKTTFGGDTSHVTGAVTATQKIVGMVLDVARIIGMGVALIMLTYIGIKFMLASPSERANIKQYSMNFIIGAFILIGGVGFLTIIKDFALKINNT